MRRSLLFLAAALTVACDASDPNEPAPQPAGPVDLRAELGADANPSGIAVDPVSGQRFVLDPALGIFELTDKGAVSLWTPDADLPPLTDLCALGGGRFIGAADGDGYIIDIAAGAAQQHFCLEPGWDPGFDPEPGEPGEPPPVQMRHVNRSVACDRVSGLIYGQPQTLPVDGEPVPMRSEVASYLLETGIDQEWIALPDPAYHAGGMALLEPGVLLLGEGSTVSRFDTRTGELSAFADLSEEVGSIEALAVDGESLLVLDGRRGLVTIEL